MIIEAVGRVSDYFESNNNFNNKYNKKHSSQKEKQEKKGMLDKYNNFSNTLCQEEDKYR